MANNVVQLVLHTQTQEWRLSGDMAWIHGGLNEFRGPRRKL